jgi:hypothetical protein
MELLKRKSQMKRERKRETRKMGKKVVRKRNLGKCSRLSFFLFLIFPCELPSSRSRAYSSTTQMANLKKEEEKKNEPDHTTRPRKIPFSLFILQQ